MPTVPGAPTAVTATGGNASATVSWSAPGNGGSAISGYTVTANPGGATVNVGGGTTSATVPGLVNGTSYTFTVYASNSIGNGPVSASSGAVTPMTLPGAPTGVTASAGNASAAVSWTAPSNGGSVITSYTVMANPGGVTVNVGGSTTATSFTGLVNGTSYTFTVFATNALGNGPTSSPSVPVTPNTAGISVVISPTRAALTTAQALQFTATVTGSSNTAASWSVDGVAGGSAALGTVDPTGLYTPPSTAGNHTLTAASQANGTISASASIAVTDLAGVFTYHNDVARTGQNLQEYALNTTNVSDPSAFGKLFSCSVDGPVYAQPLYVANLSIGGGTHNVVFVVTSNDSVYAFDADGATDSSGNCLAYWYQSFLTAGATAVPVADTMPPPLDLLGTYGILGTPVIGNSTIYLVARTKTGTSQYSEQLVALNINTGNNISGSPVTIAPTVPGNSQGGTAVAFSSLEQAQRPALLLFNGVVYVAFGSCGDINPYNGWVLGYDATTLAPTAVFNSTPNGGYNAGGGIWMAGAGPAADANYIYISTGNGVFDDVSNTVPPAAPLNDLGDSVLKFNGGLAVQDFFTPAIQANLAANDMDFGSGGVVVLPDSMGSTAHPHLVVAVGKPGNFYLEDRDAMGRYLTGAGSTDANVQTLSAGSGSNGYLQATPTVWGNTIYIAAFGTAMQAYPVSNAQIGASTMQTSDLYAYSGATAAISAQGSTNGILWAIDNKANGATNSNGQLGPAILRAYDATNLSVRLFSSDASPADTGGFAVKYTVPTIANGKVYVGGAAPSAPGQAGQLTVYGLKP